VAGAMAERDFAEKLEKAGFTDVVIDNRVPFGIDDIALYPLFTPDLLALMRALIPRERQAAVAISVIARAGKS
jgi:arsenite methyltransferase